MVASDDLFLLIKSLGKSEKRLFKLYVSRYASKKENNYLLLFEAIESQKTYDEAAIKKQFSGATIEKHLPSEKNYLYNLILSSLSIYHAHSTTELSVKEMLRQVEILYNKTLFKQSAKLLKKAKKIANTMELKTLLFDIARWERNILLQTLESPETLEGDIQNLYEQRREFLKKIENNATYLNIADKILIALWKAGPVRDKHSVQRLRSIIGDPLLKKEERAISYESKLLFNHIHANYSIATGDIHNEYFYTKRTVELIESNPEQLNNNPNPYLQALNNFHTACTRIKKFDELSNSLEKLKELFQKSQFNRTEKTSILLRRSIYNMDLVLYCNTGQFKKGVELIPEIKKWLVQHESKIQETGLWVVYFNIAYTYFGIKDYKNALLWLNKIINSQKTHLRDDLYSFAMIVNMIIYYELGKEDIIPYVIKSTFRFLKKRNRLYAFEKAALDFIYKTLPKSNSQRILIAGFKRLKNELEEIARDPFEQKALENFDLISWLESKIEKSLFSDVVKEKAQIHSLK